MSDDNTQTIRPVKDILPHREPFLFLEEVLEMTDTTIRASSYVDPEGPHFRGHYPGNPILPGVILCETVLQCGAYLMAVKMGEDSEMKGAPLVTRMTNVKFRNMVKPGDRLEVFAEHKVSRMGAHMLAGKITRDGKPICSLEFTVMLVVEEAAK